MSGNFVEITLYSPGDDPGEGKTYHGLVTLGMVERALTLQVQMNALNGETEHAPAVETRLERFRRFLLRNHPPISDSAKRLNLLGQFVVDLFGGQFTLKQLKSGADFGEIMSVLTAVVTRANGFSVNPTSPLPIREKRFPQKR